MDEIRRSGEGYELRLSVMELRTIVGALGETLDGDYAIPHDEWAQVVGQRVELGESLLSDLLAVLARDDAG